MNKYSYDTPIDLAKAICEIVSDANVNSIVDICCGSWNLLKAGKKIFPTASLYGVDIDASSGECKIEGAGFEICDGRIFALRESKKGWSYDLILSNPPFGTMRDDEVLFGLQKKDSSFYSHLLVKRYECEMVQANCLLAHEGSILIFILPCTFVIGRSYLKARMQLAKDYFVFAIIELPDTVFGSNRIKTFAIVLNKKRDNRATLVYQAVYNDEWVIKKKEYVSKENIEKGYWAYKETDGVQGDIRVIRGNISSGTFANYGERILHCSIKKEGKWKPSVRFFDKSKCASNKVIYANRGDIVIDRIGKSAGYWEVCDFDSIAISDCLYIIKKPNQKVIQNLINHSEPSGRLSVPLKGVTTVYITAEDVTNALVGRD